MRRLRSRSSSSSDRAKGARHVAFVRLENPPSVRGADGRPAGPRPRRLRRQQCPDAGGKGEGELGRGAEPVSAAGRPDPEPGRDGEGLRRAGARGADRGHRGAAKASQVKVDASTITDPAKFKEYQEAQNQLSGALGRLLVTVERYPELKSNQNFLALQSQLEGTENRVAVARRDYIQAVQAFNTEIRTFPGVIWARLFWGAKPMESFAATAGAERPPAVKF